MKRPTKAKDAPSPTPVNVAAAINIGGTSRGDGNPQRPDAGGGSSMRVHTRQRIVQRNGRTIVNEQEEEIRRG